MNGYFIYEKYIQEKKNLNSNIINDFSNNNNNEKKDDLNNPEKENNIIDIGDEKQSLVNNNKISKEDSFEIIDINIDEEIISEPKNKEQIYYSSNGLTFSYFFSFIISLIIRDSINTEIENKKKNYNLYYISRFFIIIIYIFFFSFCKKKKG